MKQSQDQMIADIEEALQPIVEKYRCTDLFVCERIPIYISPQRCTDMVEVHFTWEDNNGI